MSKTEHYIYPRDKDGKLLGHTICILSLDKKIFYGQSICSTADRFDKRVGRTLALARATEAAKRYTEKIDLRKQSENLLGKIVKVFKGN